MEGVNFIGAEVYKSWHSGLSAEVDYQVRQNKVAPQSFSLFSQQPFGILISNFTRLFPEIFYI